MRLGILKESTVVGETRRKGVDSRGGPDVTQGEHGAISLEEG